MKESEVLTVVWEDPDEHPGVIRYIASSSIGGRESQQDSLYIGEKGNESLAVVCDGMGGLNGGERASELAVQMLAQSFFTQSISDVPKFFRDMANQMDEAVHALRDGGKLLGAGTTIVSVLIRDASLYWLSVGDSKIYISRQGQMICPVVEHNYRMILNRMLNAGKIDRTAYNDELPKAEALVSFLGLGGLEHIEINQNPFKLEPGDQILLCSDGLYKSLDEEEILDILKLRMELDVKAKMLLEKALNAGGARQDNTSIILIQA